MSYPAIKRWRNTHPSRGLKAHYWIKRTHLKGSVLLQLCDIFESAEVMEMVRRSGGGGSESYTGRKQDLGDNANTLYKAIMRLCVMSYLSGLVDIWGRRSPMSATNIEWSWYATAGPARGATLMENVGCAGAQACVEEGVYGAHVVSSMSSKLYTSCYFVGTQMLEDFFRQFFNGLWLYNFVTHVFHLFLTFCFFKLKPLWMLPVEGQKNKGSKLGLQQKWVLKDICM